ncbi:hypothetical protein VPH35_066779 [Triticum aestivum]|uniref:F-box protein AT5G49610-like beta-propeller domain-containing protein n=2 Tax=Triticum aestivum TaxID=4565 RepID=A0A3B6HWP1_WHEAT
MYLASPGIGHGLAQVSQTVAQHFLDPDHSIVAIASGDSGLMTREELPAPGYMLITPGGDAAPMGDGVPLSPTVAAATPNTWGHFAKLGAEHAFFVQDPAADFDIMPKGVCMNDDSPVHYHVNVFAEGVWQNMVSGPMHAGDNVCFLRRPYAVVIDGVMYMMYEVGRVVACNVSANTFDTVQLPEDFAFNIEAGGTDYRVTKTSSGKLCIAQVQGMRARVWDRDPTGVWVERINMSISSVFDVPATDTMWIRVAENEGLDIPIWDTEFYLIRIVSVDEGARHLVMSFGFDTRVYCIDTELERAFDLFDSAQHAFMSNVVPVTVTCPPRFPDHI